MKEEGKRSWKARIEYSLAFVWLTAMALGGFFLPGFLNTIPLLKIKLIEVSGTQTVSPDVISSACYQASKGSWLFLSSDRLLAKANNLAKNSIESVRIKKELSWDGAKIKVEVQERKPIASVVHDNTILLLDSAGEFFYNPAMEGTLPVVYTFSFDYVKKHFPNLKALIDYVKQMELKIKEIYVTDRSTVAYISSNKIVLPPISKLDSYMFDRIKKAYNKVEMNSAEIFIISGSMAIIKEGN
ncbi:cell division protein FtsQ/DivIB [Thermocrinis sp.]